MTSHTIDSETTVDDPEEAPMLNMSKEIDRRSRQRHKSLLLATLILVVGASVSGAFLALGVTGAKQETVHHFEKQADELAKAVESTWKEYSLVNLWTHEACHDPTSNSSFDFCEHAKFSELYQYVGSGGLDFQALSWVPNITHDQRPRLEKATRDLFSRRFPTFPYEGIREVNYTAYQVDNSLKRLPLVSRTEQQFYLPCHYMFPLEGVNLFLTDFDLYSSSQRPAIDKAFATLKPTISGRYRLLDDDKFYQVTFLHPGIELENNDHMSKPNALSGIMVSLSDLLIRSVRSQREALTVYIYDTTDGEVQAPFLVGAKVKPPQIGGAVEMGWLEEVEISSVQSLKSLVRVHEIPVEDRKWSVVVVDLDGSYETETVFVLVGGIIIFLACGAMALWFFTSAERSARIQDIQATADAEKAALIVDNAKKAALAERQLNDYIAHEVRNPLSSAISACSFVSSALREQPPMATEQSRLVVQEDVEIISSSLSFINDLLRSMLDSHRAANNQMKIELKPTDIMKDILDPVAAILYCRDANFEVQTECPEHLVVNTDRLRLKQIVLNLANNSRKFVQAGFIRLRAQVLSDNVYLFVEDSGPGIPAEKRRNLFEKFQESLDAMNQGTGIGLCLCKDLALLLGGSLWLDESYDSGVEGFVGTRFVVKLNTSPILFDDEIHIDGHQQLETTSGKQIVRTASGRFTCGNTSLSELETKNDTELPIRLSILFVDDDLILRKLFTRSVRRLAPEWTIREAASGEAALKMAEKEEFDLIFLDQYMASVERQMLGTETARALRAQGCLAGICGLSANDVSKPFLDAGADAFLIKPLPCEKEALTREIIRILDSRSFISA